MIHFLLKYKALFLIPLFYIFLSKIFYTLLLTIVTSAVLMTGQSGQELSNTVNEIASQYVMASYALAALLAALTVWLGDKALYSHVYFWNEENKKIWQLERKNRKEFYRGVSSGVIAALVLTSILVVTGQINFLGIYITSTIGTPVFPIFLTNFISVIVLLISDEFIFRHKVLLLLRQQVRIWPAILISSGLYILVKMIQFPITPVGFLNLLLLNLMLAFLYCKNGKAHRGLGFVLAMIGILHPICGLPLWGQTSPSFFLMKQTAKSSEWMTGGAAGPLASIGLFSIFAFLCGATYFSWKQDLD